jgi:hypothetical protein
MRHFHHIGFYSVEQDVPWILIAGWHDSIRDVAWKSNGAMEQVRPVHDVA